MKALIVSDTHGSKKELQRVLERHREEVHTVIHCGDSELLRDDDILSGIHIVEGNVDTPGQFPAEVSVEVEGITIYAAHGHLLNVKSDIKPIAKEAEKNGASLVCSGHSHIAAAEVYQNRLFVNPGSLLMPRTRMEKTYAVVEFPAPAEANVKFYEEQSGKEVEDLSGHFFL